MGCVHVGSFYLYGLSDRKLAGMIGSEKLEFMEFQLRLEALGPKSLDFKLMFAAIRTTGIIFGPERLMSV